jgi:DsbE subfamily thiol:disulfide oxidoreductase
VAAGLKRLRLHLMPLGLGVILLAACSLQQPLAQANQSQALVGHQAPDWVGTDLDGHRIALKDFRGQPLFLNFWASWCGPCRAEQPGLDRIARDYQGRGLKVVGVDIRDSQDQARIYRDEFKMPYPSVFDQAAHLGYAYQVDAPPSSIFIDPKGVIVFKITGELSEADYRRALDDKLFPTAHPSAQP